MSHWLVKSEPLVYSIDDFRKDKTTGWDGVRNFLARNFMRDQMQPGDLVFFYHSSCEPPGLVGLARVDGPAVVDPTQFDPKSEYYDATSDRAEPRWMMARLRFVGNPELDTFAEVRGRREYRRLLRRQLYGGGEAVMIEGIVERKSWLHEILDDLMVLVWTGTDHANVMATAKRELDLLYRNLNEGDLRLEDYGRVMVCISVAEIDDNDDSTSRGERLRLRELLGQDLNNNDESPLVASNAFIIASAHTLDFSDEPSDNEEEP